MPWKCPQCVVDVPDTVNVCPECMFARFPAGVAFRSDTTGKELPVRLEATFGRGNLKILGDPDVQYVSREQFRIEKCTEQGGWAIVPIAWAEHPLFINGSPLDAAGTVLKDGDRISIKDKFLHMTVRVIMT